MITKFSSLSPTERIIFIESLPFWDLVELRNILDNAYRQNGMWEAYIIECNKEIEKRRNDKIDSLLK
jgi:hypothetical protein